MSNAISAFGTQLQRGDGGGPEVFTAVAEVSKIDGFEISMDTPEVTNHQSTEGWREYVAGLIDGGEVALELNYIPTNATQNATAGLLADLKNRTKRNFKIVFPDSGSTTWSFSAFVTKFKPSAPTDDKLMGTATVKVTGKPTLA